MTTLAVPETEPVACPTWCVSARAGEHSHVSREVHAKGAARPLTAKLLQVRGEESPRFLVNGHTATVEQAETFAYMLLRLVAEATMAEPGLGFIEALASRGEVTLAEMARATGIEEERLQAQREGGQVLTAHEFDQLALAVAQLTAGSAC